MMKNQQFANTECLDKNRLSKVTETDSIKKLATKVIDKEA